jgi:hypothetical protein
LTKEGKTAMSTLKTHTPVIPYPDISWVKKFGWYGMAFFFIKGTLWLIIPLIMYAVN